MSHKTISILVLLAMVLGGGLIVAGLIVLKPEPERKDDAASLPPVAVMTVSPQTLTLTVEAQGTVAPQRQIDMVSQVAGRVVKISPNFFDGRFFEAGETLVWIDDRDYRNALTRAQADVAGAQQQLALEQAEAEQAARDWDLLGGEGEPTPLVLRKPQLAEAQARLDGARASLADAQLNLERTQLSAPFAGRVREKGVDAGQFVTGGQALGTVYATDVVEIRLPLTDRQASFLDLPMSPLQRMAPVPVTISTTFTGRTVKWDGVIRRTEGAIDPRSRVIVAIAEVTDPFNLTDGADVTKAPLSVGLFVTAEIEGRTYDNVYRINRRQLRDDNTVIVVGPEDRLVFKTVTVLRTTADHAFISGGLEPRDRIMMTTLDAPVEGMRVEVTGTTPERGSAAGSVSAGAAP